jgi:uncharacterized membrane protein
MRGALVGSLAFLCVQGGCGGDRPLPSPAAATPDTTAAELRRPRCDDGVVAPAGFLPVTEIPTVGSDVIVQDVNNAGVVVGSQRMPDGNWHAFRYRSRDGLQDLALQPGFGAQSFATAIAQDGAVGGEADHGDGTSALFGYRFTDGGGHVEICPTVCSVWDLDWHGRVAGLIVDPSDATAWQAFLFSPAAGLQRLGTLGGARSSASAINDAGLVAGNAQLATSVPGDVGHAFIFDAAHGMRDLNSVANAPGWVLQTANDATRTQLAGYGVHGGVTRAFLYGIADRSVRDLGTPAGDGSSFAYALNANGDVAGYAVRDGHFNDAFVYGANIGMRKVGDFVDPAEGWDLQQADGINDGGIIVGWGYHNGVARGYQLTLPVCRR